MLNADAILKTQHRITAVIINKVSLSLKMKKMK